MVLLRWSQSRATLNLTFGYNAGLWQSRRVLELPLNGRQVTELVLPSGTAKEVEGPVSHLNSVSRNYKAVLADGFAGAVL